jgi:hypothetical protein
VSNVRALFIATATVAVVALAAGTAVASNLVVPKTVVFKGSYAGTVTEKVDGQTVTALASARGAGTAVGKGKLGGTVTGTTANPPCSPLSGPGTITGPYGKLKLTLLSTARACAASEEDQNSITVSGNAKVAGGTLKFRNAKGTLHFSGHYDRSSGAFNVNLTGKFTY